MALFTCGFEMADAEYLTRMGWWFRTAPTFYDYAVNPEYVHKTLDGNGGKYSMTALREWRTPIFPPGAEWLHFWVAADGDDQTFRMTFLMGGDSQITADFRASGTILLLVPTGGLYAGKYSEKSWKPGRDHWIAIRMVSHATTGIVEVWVDGEQVANWTGLDTLNRFQGWNQIYQSYSGADSAWDDIIVTTAAEGRLAEHVAAPLLPNGDTAQEDMTAEGGPTDNHECLDDIPPVTTTYCQASAVNDEDHYDLTDMTWTPDSVHCVTGFAYALRDGVITDGDIVVDPGVAADYIGDALPAADSLGVFQGIWNKNPDTAADWIATTGVSEINNLLGGFRFTT